MIGGSFHRYKFNPVKGRNVSGEGYYLKAFFIEQTETVCLFVTFIKKVKVLMLMRVPMEKLYTD